MMSTLHVCTVYVVGNVPGSPDHVIIRIKIYTLVFCEFLILGTDFQLC